MKTLVKAIVLSISTALIATSAMATPQDHQPHKPYAQQHPKALQHHAPQHKQAYKKVDPSRDWRVGQKVPSQYQSRMYEVEHSKYIRLNKPGRNQQWIKVNGDYVLMNVVNDKVIKIIAG